MSDITILVSDESMKVVYERVSRSTLRYSADGLMVYVLGQSKYHHDDCLRNLALSECLLRHIPVITLRDRRHPLRAGKAIRSDTQDMFSKKR